jgi:hypothetical protein
MPARKVSVLLKPHAAAGLTKELDDEVIPRLRKKEGAGERGALAMGDKGKKDKDKAQKQKQKRRQHDEKKRKDRQPTAPAGR